MAFAITASAWARAAWYLSSLAAPSFARPTKLDTGESQQVTARFEHPEAFSPNLNARYRRIPFLAHKAQAVGWVCYHAVDGIVRQAPHQFQAVACKDSEWFVHGLGPV